VPKNNDPIRRDDAAVERARKRWPNKDEDEILALLRQVGEELDRMAEEDKKDASS
jgi:hypothetical protein